MWFEPTKGAKQKTNTMDKVCFTLPTMEQVLFSVIPEEEDQTPEQSISAIEKDAMVIGGF